MDATVLEQVVGRMTRPRRQGLDEEGARLLLEGVRDEVWHEGRLLAVHTFGDARPDPVSGAPRRRALLVHGWESRAAAWHVLVRRLVAEGWHVTVFDAPAHGESGGEATNVLAIGCALLAVGAWLGPVDAVVAHSLGSPAALYAFAHGLRTGASVHLAGPSSLVRALERTACALRIDGQALRTRFEAATGIAAADMELERLAAGMRHRALLLHDPLDPEVHWSESAALANAWDGALLEAANGVGHRKIIGDDAVVGRIVAFLR
jgi:predicted alpha/beta hydrolase family esterase